MKSREVVIVDGARSAFGRLGGGLRKLAGTDIAAFVVDGLLEKTKILERGTVDSLLAGCALSDAQTRAMARYIVLKSKLPLECSGTFVEMQCGSAITSLNHAAWKIKMGMSDIAVVGGFESYSTMPASMSTSNEPYKGIAPAPIKRRISPFPEKDIDMISVSDKMASIWGVTREEADEFAVRSQERLAKAYSTGLIGSEIIPYVIPATKKTPEIIVDKDEQPRPETSMEGLSKLNPVKPGGVTTAGNSSGRNDGAAFLLVMTAEKAEELGYTPYARWIGCSHHGCSEDIMGIGPAYSNLEALKNAGLKVSDLDVFECNEAFAAQNLSVIKEMETQSGLKIDQEKWNPNGGAIAIGHPNGASGARIAWFAMKQLEKAGGKYGLISSCCGGGHGTTAVLENLRR